MAPNFKVERIDQVDDQVTNYFVHRYDRKSGPGAHGADHRTAVEKYLQSQ